MLDGIMADVYADVLKARASFVWSCCLLVIPLSYGWVGWVIEYDDTLPRLERF